MFFVSARSNKLFENGTIRFNSEFEMFTQIQLTCVGIVITDRINMTIFKSK